MSAQDQTREPRQYFFTQSFGDLPEELQTVRTQGKKGILFFFEAENCPYCHYMLQHVFNQKNVQDWYQKRFMSLAIDIHGDVDLKDFDGVTLPSKIFAEQRRVVITPVMMFIDLDGNEVYRHLGMIKTPEEFLLLGKYIASNSYFDMEFKVYAAHRNETISDQVLMTPGAQSDPLKH